MSANGMKRQRSRCKAKMMSRKAGDSSSYDSILTFRTDILSKGGLGRWPHITLHGNELQSAVEKGC